MGIPGILKEIGKGERVALAKLAVEHFERSRRPYRIAIDAAIWNFQNQAGQGGKNPALRTLFYRLLKLLALPIQPVFVFDGKNKPLTKRGKTVSRYGTCISNEMSKKLIDAFRFPCHTAPGEAEAECAMLQSSGLVDAVMSQDVDAIMFGSTVTLRDWSKESKHNKTATHVSILDQNRVKDISGLDPDGMILVALLSGGDYDESGIAGFGVGLACEAARAGFGEDLLNLCRAGDEAGLVEWRERLQYELESNESGHFRSRHKTVKIPETFPEKQILSYYMSPAVSPQNQLPALESKWRTVWESKIDVNALRQYVADTFDWCYKPGAWKFVRVMAPALLANDLICGSTSAITSANQITERRRHFTSDGILELRITVVPTDIVALDLEAEEDSLEYLASVVDGEDGELGVDATEGAPEGSVPPSPSKSRKTPTWKPYSAEKMWVAEIIVMNGARSHVEEWDKIQQDIVNARLKRPTTRANRTQQRPAKDTLVGGMRTGAILSYTISSTHSHKESRQLAEISMNISGDTKSTVKGPSKLATPTKQRTRRHVLDTSPSMQNYFKSVKNVSPNQSVQEESDPVEKLSQEFEEVLGFSDSLVGEKHSRPSTSNSSEIAQKIATKPTKKLRKERGNATRTTSPRPTILTQISPAKPSTRAGAVFGGQDAESAIVIASSPADAEATMVEARGMEDNLTHDEITNHITPRTGDRKKRVLKTSKSTSTANGSPVRVRRPIEEFFAPYIAAAQREKAARAQAVHVEDDSTLGHSLGPTERGTGLSTALSPTHINVTSRSSLPGTWREVPHDPGAASQNLAMAGTSASRLSIIDLTEI
ncbi:hypothetical protein LTR84_010394 [Exophiala bonariae]|uniref:XPG-I domain-containing protein n=1 Tax=Exophiala bonariae TaxID=1690606 RepID=A0AAV9MWB5_9EURO|nr:hypothetical protein LTR84_010394 [Exophiala bonariae]